MKDEIDLWLKELAQVAAPYYGLDKEVARRFLKALSDGKIEWEGAKHPETQETYEERAITNALLATDFEMGLASWSDEQLRSTVSKFSEHCEDKYGEHPWITGVKVNEEPGSNSPNTPASKA